jgi:hypothetical protein
MPLRLRILSFIFPFSNFLRMLAIKNHIFPIMMVGLVFLFGCLWKFQGWQEQSLKFHDMLPYHVGALQMLQTGTVLEKGDISSFHSYSPPGTVWLLAPGTFLRLDPRITEMIGMSIQYLGMLIFLYLLSNMFFGRMVALAALAMVGISRLGFLGIWPIGHPAYLLGILYFLALWHRHRSTLALGAALFCLSFGLLVDLTILPAIFIFPAVWLFLRPPIQWKPLLLSLVVCSIVWIPYLRYEQSRNFLDIQSMLFQKPIAGGKLTPSTQAAICQSSLPGESGTWSGAYADLGLSDQGSRYYVEESNSLLGTLRFSTCRILTNLDRNFDANLFLFGSYAPVNIFLWVLFFTGMIAILACGVWGIWPRVRKPFFILRKPLPAVILLLMIPLAFFLLLFPFGPLTSSPPPLKLSEPWLALLWQLSLFAPLLWFGTALGLWLALSQERYHTDAISILAMGVWIPWLILLVTAEPDQELRFWWIWPMECVAVCVCLWLIGAKLPLRKVRWGLLLLGCILLAPWTWWQARVQDWQAHGYAGKDTGQLSVVAYLVQKIHSQPANGRVGYDIITWHYADWDWSRGNPYFREGAWFDYLLQLEGGIKNQNQSISGLEEGDLFRVFEIPPPCETDIARAAAPWPGYTFERQFTCFAIYKMN